MRKTFTLLFLAAIAAQCRAQSAPTLADAARAARESKQSAESAKANHKVYTNENLPPAAIKDAEDAREKESPLTAPGKKTTALQWKAAIASQKNLVFAHQDRIEKAEKSIQFVTASGYANGKQYNAEQKRRQDQLEAEKKKVEQEKQKLDEMKEAARKAGFGSAVYDQ
jgi:predicted nucleic acid-binding protein